MSVSFFVVVRLLLLFACLFFLFLFGLLAPRFSLKQPIRRRLVLKCPIRDILTRFPVAGNLQLCIKLKKEDSSRVSSFKCVTEFVRVS